jgi:hypothetical protein
MQGEPFGRAKGTRGQTLAGESNPSYLHYLQYIQHCTVPYARLAVVRPCLAHRPHISGNLTVYLSPYLERPARHEKSARPYKPRAVLSSTRPLYIGLPNLPNFPVVPAQQQDRPSRQAVFKNAAFPLIQTSRKPPNNNVD